MDTLIQLKRITSVFRVTFSFACLGLSVASQAVLPSPTPDGGYPGGNTAEGSNALFSLTTGGFNAAVGWLSLKNLATGSFNTAIGAGSLFANTADENTGVGTGALLLNSSGSQNTANGVLALFNNTTGIGNTANGFEALFSNTIGYGGTAVGYQALVSNTGDPTGAQNTAVGCQALYGNTIGYANTATGNQALFKNTTGLGNTAYGNQALLTATGSSNTGVGANVLFNNGGGSSNTAVGYASMFFRGGDFNTALGDHAGAGNSNLSGDHNVYIGAGMTGVDGESNACYIASIYGQTCNGVPVYINASSKLGTATSSKRFKQDIKSMGKTSETLFDLKPVTFCYKKDIDPKGSPQFGLVAEDVEKVNPDLVVRDKEGKPYIVRYDQVNAMLLNEFLKEHKTVHQQGATIARQQKQIEALTAGLQEVSAELGLSKAAPRTVLNSR